MNDRKRAIMSGVFWIVFSPIALLMAMISTVESLTVYYIQVVLMGGWTACGVVAGIGRITGVSWARRLQMVLSLIAFAYFSVCGILMLGYLFVAIFNQKIGEWSTFLVVSVGVIITGVPFFYLARRYSKKNDVRNAGN